MGLVVGQQLGRAAAAAFLVQLGQFARHRHFAARQHLADRGERLGQPGRGLEEHQRRLDPRQLFQRLGARLVLGREKPSEQEAVVGQARQRQRGERRARPRQRRHRDVRRPRLAHQPEAGIGNQRRPRIADQRHGLGPHRLDQPRSHVIAAMVIVAPHRLAQAEMSHELAGHAGVFAGDCVAPRQGLGCPHGQVAEIANRRGDNIQPRLKPWMR
jgi:hypothetical protein